MAQDQQCTPNAALQLLPPPLRRVRGSAKSRHLPHGRAGTAAARGVPRRYWGIWERDFFHAARKGDAPIVVVARSAMIPLYVEVARYSATYVADGFGTRPPVIDLDQPPSCASGAGEPGRLRLARISHTGE